MIFEQTIRHYKRSKIIDFNLIFFHSFCSISNRYETVTSQRQRDKQRLVDLERNFNEEKQQKQRLESQMKTEKALTKKLQDDLTKLTSAPPR